MRLARARAWFGTLLFLGMAAGCGGNGGDGDEQAHVASEEEVEAFDPALAQHLPPNVTPEQAQEGREEFVVCATCHGPDARGTQLGPPLRDQEWTHIDGSYEDIQRIIRDGVAEPEDYPVPMPRGGAASFSEEQLRGVAAYVFALSRSGAP